MSSRTTGELISYQIQNFKPHIDSGEIEIAPLTLIFGPNNSGKTALIEPLLMRKQSTHII